MSDIFEWVKASDFISMSPCGCRNCRQCDATEAREKMDKLEAQNAVMREALKFYGFDAIHNPLSDKSEQYWNDVGIWDHGERARNALARCERLAGGDNADHE